jgi:hypothetical protein
MFSRAKGKLHWKTKLHLVFRLLPERGGNLFSMVLRTKMEGVFMRETVWVLYVTFFKT